MSRLFQNQMEVDAHNARVRQGLSEPAAVPVLLEKDIQRPVLQALLNHPKCVFAWRANSGKFKLADLYGERWITVNFRGCADLLGMLKGGKFLACETKKPGQALSIEQEQFRDKVIQGGGVFFVATSVADVYAALKNV